MQRVTVRHALAALMGMSRTRTTTSMCPPFLGTAVVLVVGMVLGPAPETQDNL